MKWSGAASRWLPRLLGPVVLGVILLRVDLGEVAAALEGVWLLPVAGACLAVLPTVALRTWRWRILVEAGGVELPWVAALNAYAFSVVVGAATPGRLGELIKIGYLRNHGAPIGVALLSVGLDRLLDLIFLAAAGAGGVAAFFGGSMSSVVLVAAVTAGSFGLLLRYAVRWRDRRAGAAWIVHLLPAAWASRISSALGAVLAEARRLPALTVMAAALLTASVWVATYFAVYLCAVGLGIDVPFADICGITAISTLVTFLPVSILGLGTREASLIALLAPYGVAATAAVALSALYLGITLWVVLICSYSLSTSAAREWKRRS